MNPNSSTPFNPYIGTKPFSRENALFGRNREVLELSALLTAERIVVLYSPSGAGKSSLINGKNGLCDRLRDRFDVWRITRVNIEPPVPARNRYTWSAAMGFEEELPETKRRSAGALAAMTLREAVMTRPRRKGAPPNRLLVFDQFEEILRVDPADPEGKRPEFFHELGELLMDESVFALLVLREDFLAPFDPYREMIPTQMRHRYRLDLLDLNAARDAIVKPTEGAERGWTPDAVDRLVLDLSRQKVQPLQGEPYFVPGRYVQPLQLQVACDEVWRGMPAHDRRVDVEDLVEFADVDTVLGRYFAGRVAEIAGPGNYIGERAIREWVDTKLITQGNMRGQVMRRAENSDGLSTAVIEKLVDARLLRAEERGGAVWFELAHDRLVEPVRKNNADWCQRNLSDLERRAGAWDAQKRSPELLATAACMKGLRVIADQEPARVTTVERDFLAASQARIDVARRHKRIVRAGVASTVACLLFGLVFLNDSVNEMNRANFTAAKFHSVEAERYLRQGMPEQAWLLTLKALAEAWPDYASEKRLSLPGTFGLFLRPEVRPGAAAGTRVRGRILEQTGAMHRLVFAGVSQKDWRIDFIDAKQTNNGFEYGKAAAKIWEWKASFGPLTAFDSKSPAPYSPNFSGELVFAATESGDALMGGENLVRFPGAWEARIPEGEVAALQWSRHGVAVLNTAGRIFLLDPTNGKARDWSLTIPAGGRAPVSFAFSPHREDRLAVGFDDGVTIGYEFKPGTRDALQEFVRIDGHMGPIRRVAFISGEHPDVVATGSEFGQIELLRLEAGHEGVLASARLHAASITSLGAYKLRGDEWMCSASADGEVIWVPLDFAVFGKRLDLLSFTKAEYEKRIEMAKELLKVSEESLQFVDDNGTFTHKGSAEELAQSRSNHFGIRPTVQYVELAAKELTGTARAEGNWLYFSIPDDKYQWRVPSQLGPNGGWAQLGHTGAGWVDLSWVKAKEGGGYRLSGGWIDGANEENWYVHSEGMRSPRPLTRTAAQSYKFQFDAAGQLDLSPSTGHLTAGFGKVIGAVLRSSIPARPSLSFEGRKLTVVAEFPSANSNAIVAEPGEMVEFHARWTVTSDSGSAPGCATCPRQFYIGLGASAESKCLLSAAMPLDGKFRRTGLLRAQVQAPAQPGTYFITMAATQAEACRPNPALHTNEPVRAVAAIVVR